MNNKKTLLIGVDAGEKKYDVTILDPISTYRRDFTVGIKRKDRDEIANRVYKAVKKTGIPNACITIESSTAPSHILRKHLSRYDWPKEMNVKVDLISPVTPRGLGKAKLIDTKTDGIDSYLTARCGEYEDLPRLKRHNERLKSLASEYTYLTKQTASLKLRIRSLLLELNPVLVKEYKTAHRDKLSLVIIGSYEVYKREGKLDAENLDSIVKQEDYRMGKARKGKLLKIINEETIDDKLYLICALKNHRGVLSLVEKQLEPLKEKIKEEGKNSSVVKLLTTIDGIGEFTAAMFFGIVQDIERFCDVDKFVGYIGTYPVKNESGDTSRKSKMTKKGVKVLKSLLYMNAITAVRVNEYAEEIFNRAVSRGKTKMQARGVIMTRLVRWIYGVWKSGEAWRQGRNEEEDIKKQKKEQEKEPQPQPSFRKEIRGQDLISHSLKVNLKKKKEKTRRKIQKNKICP